MAVNVLPSSIVARPEANKSIQLIDYKGVIGGNTDFFWRQKSRIDTDAAYERGVRFLLDTQQEDGSWHVTTRAMAFQWRTYPVLQFGDPLPAIVTVVLNPLDVPALGAGECTITTVAAAVGNAVFDATGVRLRQAPFTPARVLAAMRRGAFGQDRPFKR